MPRFLVTAGNTRERIDRVRDWGNIFTGNTGLRIAHALSEIGEVDLLTSNRTHLAELAEDPRITASPFTTHAELRGALAALLARQNYDAIFMTAAVADYRPVRTYEVVERQVSNDGTERWSVRDAQAGKVKSSHQAIAVLGERTEKLVDLFRTEWRHRGLLVKFKLEVGIGKDELIRIGQASRTASGADYLVANTLDMVDGDHAGAFLLSDAGHEWVPRDELPARLARLTRETLRL
jgi:phosphopantothenoylcysteine synthetase/decarboxylase